MLKDLKLSVLLICLTLLGLAALPAYPQRETTSVKLRPTEVENGRKLLGEGRTASGRIPRGGRAYRAERRALAR
jgi:hypothetical protein